MTDKNLTQFRLTLNLGKSLKERGMIAAITRMQNLIPSDVDCDYSKLNDRSFTVIFTAKDESIPSSCVSAIKDEFAKWKPRVTQDEYVTT